MTPQTRCDQDLMDAPFDAKPIQPRRVVPERRPDQVGAWKYAIQKRKYTATPLTPFGWIVVFMALGMFSLVSMLARLG